MNKKGDSIIIECNNINQMFKKSLMTKHTQLAMFALAGIALLSGAIAPAFAYDAFGNINITANDDGVTRVHTDNHSLCGGTAYTTLLSKTVPGTPGDRHELDWDASACWNEPGFFVDAKIYYRNILVESSYSNTNLSGSILEDVQPLNDGDNVKGKVFYYI